MQLLDYKLLLRYPCLFIVTLVIALIIFLNRNKMRSYGTRSYRTSILEANNCRQFRIFCEILDCCSLNTSMIWIVWLNGYPGFINWIFF